MKILVLNSGSSSIKCQHFVNQQSVASVLIERIGEETSYSEVYYKGQTFNSKDPVLNHHQALEVLFSMLKKVNAISSINELDAVGHRVVHGGSNFSKPTLITPEVVETIESLIPMAPLHNPANLDGINIVSNLAPNLTQVAVFDTAFHQTMPKSAALYPIAYELYENLSIRRYGFHGTSHAYVAKKAAQMMSKELNELNLITLHLGNGASATAIKDGKSIDTSMGLTPLEGLMMGTRCGDIDPAIIHFLSHNKNMSIDTIDKMLNKESGLKGICGTNDMREVVIQAEQNNTLSMLALEMFVHRVKKYIGAYTVILGHVDAVIFTGGIGERAAKVREMVCRDMDKSIGLEIDLIKNEKSLKTKRAICSKKSKIKVFVIPTNEELEIALQTEKVVKTVLS